MQRLRPSGLPVVEEDVIGALPIPADQERAPACERNDGGVPAQLRRNWRGRERPGLRIEEQDGVRAPGDGLAKVHVLLAAGENVLGEHRRLEVRRLLRLMTVSAPTSA